jgi:SAM-dependent methyltransferase
MNEAEERQEANARIFWGLHEGLPKQGPGSDPTTRRALDLGKPVPPNPRVIDLGCGPGRQTMALAEATGGQVTAIDLLPPFLDQLSVSSRERGLDDQITIQQGNMADLAPLDLADESFDLVWSEGAIYIIGFDEGLRDWQRLLAPGGRLAVTEVSWLVEDPPMRIRSFWEGHYPGMRSQQANEQAIAEAGYRLIDSFVVPDHEWWDDYYTLIEARLDVLRGERDDVIWREIIAAHDEEVAVVREGLSAFGYVFYIMERA